MGRKRVSHVLLRKFQSEKFSSIYLFQSGNLRQGTLVVICMDFHFVFIYQVTLMNNVPQQMSFKSMKVPQSDFYIYKNLHMSRKFS